MNKPGRKLTEGMVIRTSYGTGPYIIKKITRGCTCPHFLDVINRINPPAQPPHLHLVLSHQLSGIEAYLNWYVEETLTSLGHDFEGNHDRIILTDQVVATQRPLF